MPDHNPAGMEPVPGDRQSGLVGSPKWILEREIGLDTSLVGEASATGVEGEGAAALRPYNTLKSLERKIITVQDLYILPNRQAS